MAMDIPAIVGLLRRAVARAKSTDNMSIETVGLKLPSIKIGIWLTPHPSSSLPFFVSEEGHVYRATYSGEFIYDDNGSHPRTRLMPVFPEGEEPFSTTVDPILVVQALMLYLSEQIRQAEANNAGEGPADLLQESLALFLAA